MGGEVEDPKTNNASGTQASQVRPSLVLMPRMRRSSSVGASSSEASPSRLGRCLKARFGCAAIGGEAMGQFLLEKWGLAEKFNDLQMDVGGRNWPIQPVFCCTCYGILD